jgi:hypothetical protein
MKIGWLFGRWDSLESEFLHVLNDAAHGAYHMRGMYAYARLTGEHQCVSAIQYGVGNVTGLGACGSSSSNHRVKHLGCDDDRFAE